MRECTPSWVQTYREYTQHQESPQLFHDWSAYTALAATLGRNVRVDRKFYTIWPNLYTLVLAASAECRKSVAVSIAKDLLVQAGDVSISSERITNASLWQQLGDLATKTGNSEMLIFADELALFLSKEETQKGVITTLTRLFTCPAFLENRTKTAGVDHIVNCCINILAATTPTDFGEIIPGAATGTGFVPRMFIVHQEVPRPRIADIVCDAALQAKLVKDLRYIRRQVKGVFTFDPEAWSWWKNWYEHEFKVPLDESLNAFYGRKHDYVIKLAMILSVSEKDDLVLTKENLLDALDAIDEMETFMTGAYQEVGATPTLKYANIILQQLINRGGVLKRSELLRMNWRKMNSQELTDTLLFLEEAEKIERQPIAPKGVLYKIKRRKSGENCSVV